jgi:predicted enzyme related to lactoylglutathione lyase
VKSAAVLYVADLGRMRSFYGACFEMEVVDEGDDYCVLESEPMTLSLVTAPRHLAPAVVPSVPPSRREDVPIKLAFAVQSIDGSRPRLAEFGGVVDPTTNAWEFRGRIHCDGVDPEGNVIELIELISPMDHSASAPQAPAARANPDHR